jgi:hypothetical protein|tara:strand:- start:971 stop:2050 length:1080 start_codon:yes stop_codon:yes gene_type:complete
MPMQQVEYEFPDPDKEENLQEVEIEAKEEKAPDVEVEGAVGRETIEKPSDKKKKDVIQAGEVEIEVEDDTPPEDRGKRPAPPQDLKDGELSEYGEKVRERLKTLSKTYHDERRAKEAVQREREALEQYAKKLVEENQQLKTRSTENHNALIESAKKQVESELAMAQQRYRQAYESGQTDAIVEAQQALNTAQIRADKVSGLKPQRVAPTEADTALQPQQNNVQSQELTAPPQPQRDEKAEAWRDENPWFGSDDEMTAFALGLHTKLTKEGVDPQSDEYYEKINSRVRQVFPDQFDEGIDVEPEEAPKPKPSNVVAPVTRSTSPKKIKLSQSQIAIARRLGVPLEIYAKQVDDLARKQNA